MASSILQHLLNSTSASHLGVIEEAEMIVLC